MQKQVAELASGAGRQGGNIKSRRRLALPPFTGRITVRQPGKRAEIRSRLDLEKDLFLRDHRFGSMPSDRDGTLLPLIVVPFVLTLEMMAEAAMHVFPGKRPVEIRRAKASRWIAVDEKKGAQITAVAKALSSGTASAFLSEQGSGRKSAEAEIVFTDKYPGPFEFEYEPVRPDKFGSDAQAAASEIYREKYMTHGPAFQVIKAVSMPEQQVMEAALCAPDPAGFFSFRTGAGMLINPVLLDACAQLTGFWAQKRLSQRFITFPSGAGSISFFSDPPAAGDHLGCRIRISEITSGFVHSEAEIFRRDLSLWAQVKDWTHIRFDLPLEMYQVWRFPQKYGLSRVIEPGGGNLQKEGVECGLPDLESIDGTIWKEAMARLYLGRAERNAYSGGTVSNPGRWLAEMMAAKDAAKEYVKLNFGGEIAPADIEIGENGDQGNFAASVPAAADGSGRLELCIVRRQGRIRAIPHNAAKQ